MVWTCSACLTSSNFTKCFQIVSLWDEMCCNISYDTTAPRWLLGSFGVIAWTMNIFQHVCFDSSQWSTVVEGWRCSVRTLDVRTKPVWVRVRYFSGAPTSSCDPNAQMFTFLFETDHHSECDLAWLYFKSHLSWCDHRRVAVVPSVPYPASKPTNNPSNPSSTLLTPLTRS